MNPEVLRIGLYALGSLLAAIGGMDEALSVAGAEPVNLINEHIAKLLFGAGTLLVGYAKTAKGLGDFSLKNVSEALSNKLDEKAK